MTGDLAWRPPRTQAGESAPQSVLLRVLARLGLLARAMFYAVLAYLAAAVATGSGRGGLQANANGALSAVAGGAIGRLALTVAGTGFVKTFRAPARPKRTRSP